MGRGLDVRGRDLDDEAGVSGDGRGLCVRDAAEVKGRGLGAKKTFHIKQMFTCPCANVVYCIRCSRYGLLYIRETKWRLGDCFAEHLR
eukprot:g26244.t1